MSLYDLFLDKKANKEILDFNKITKEELQILFYEESKSDGIIADLFNVKSSTITSKRKKMGINLRDLILKDNIEKIIKEKSNKELMTIENLSKISKAITHFAFRNGPVEKIHANNRLTDKDMETLNKFMVNRLAYIFKLIIEEKWFEFSYLINCIDKYYGIDWDAAIPDDGGNIKSLQIFINESIKC